METLKTRSVVGEDRRLRIELEVALPPGPVEVVLVVSQDAEAPAERYRSGNRAPALPRGSRLWRIW